LRCAPKGRAVVVDLVQHDAVGLAGDSITSKAATAGLVAAGGRGILVDQAAERPPWRPVSAEIDHDDEAAHSPPPFTRQ
jgi:hypothetical protein